MASRAIGVTAAVAAACLACGAPQPAEPAGALFAAHTASFERLLDRLTQLEGTRLGRRAAELRAELPRCRSIGARVPGPDAAALLAALRCVEGDPRLEAFDHARGDRDLALDWPLGDGKRMRVRLGLDDLDDTDVELLLPPGFARGAAALLVPGPESPGPAHLAGAGALFHARVRPSGGIDLAALVANDGPAQRLFRLKSRIFAGAVLDGTWEAAAYLPEPGEAAPPLALALGFDARDAAIAAMEALIKDVRSTWPVERTAFSLDGAPGACLPDLRVMPGLAPCYVATERALVVGWNAASIERALAGGATGLGHTGGVLVELARFAEADANLAGRAVASGETPWTRLRAVGREEKEGVRMRVHLEVERGA